MNRKKALLLAVSAVALALSGWLGVAAYRMIDYWNGTTADEATMNMQEAGDRSEEILDETLGGIYPAVKWVHRWNSDVPCTDVLNRSTGTSSVTRGRAVVTKISHARRGAFLGVIEREWKKRGYEIVGVNRSKKYPEIQASTPDGFSVKLTIGREGIPFLDVDSPCVKNSDMTARPETDDSDIHPRHESDFWSVDEPIPGASS